MRQFLILALLFFCSWSTAHAILAKPSPTFHVYLTFDDGPLAGSSNVRTALLEEQVKATILVVGSRLESKASLQLFQDYKLNDKLEIGNHSYSHANGRYRSFYSRPEEVVRDIQKNQDAFKFLTDSVRLPGRNIWRLPGIRRTDLLPSAGAADLVYRAGFRVYGWDTEWRRIDSKHVITAEQLESEIYRQLLKNRTLTPGHIVILCHDSMFRTSAQEAELRKFITSLKKSGKVEFNQLQEYPIPEVEGVPRSPNDTAVKKI